MYRKRGLSPISTRCQESALWAGTGGDTFAQRAAPGNAAAHCPLGELRAAAHRRGCQAPTTGTELREHASRPTRRGLGANAGAAHLGRPGQLAA